MFWLMPQWKAFCIRFSPSRIELHICAYGSPHVKPTLFLTTAGPVLSQIGKLCPGRSPTHLHEALTGTVVIDGKQVCKTKLAQVYPHQLCKAYASAVSSVLDASRRDAVVARAEPSRRRSAREQAATGKLRRLGTEISEVHADEPMPSAPVETLPVRSRAVLTPRSPVCFAPQPGMVDPFGLGSSDLDGSQFKDTFSLKTPAELI